MVVSSFCLCQASQAVSQRHTHPFGTRDAVKRRFEVVDQSERGQRSSEALPLLGLVAANALLEDEVEASVLFHFEFPADSPLLNVFGCFEA